MSSADDNGESSPLLALLRARIEREGPMPVEAYMRACLADPEHGYWRRAETIGTGGDFITAPEISQVFGELIGLWCAVVWQDMGSPAPLRLVELGPGRGTLMRDVLRAARAVPPFLAAASVHLIEISAPLREAQRQTLASSPRRVVSKTRFQHEDAPPARWRGSTQLSTPARPDALDPRLRAREEIENGALWDEGDMTQGFPSPRLGGVRGGVNPQASPVRAPPTPDPSPQGGGGPRGSCLTHQCPGAFLHTLEGGDDVSIAWHESIEQVPEGPAIVIANEFLDALPIRQLVFADGTWRERVVDVDPHGGLQFAAGPKVTVGAETLATSPAPGTILELRAGEDELLARLAARASPLVALFIDYGPAQPATGDTLQAVRRHAWVDPLSRPGRADLTAHVQFASLARKARAAGLAVDGPMTQAEFLGRLGVAERAARLMAANPEEAGTIEAGVQRLISPTGMGELFKVLAVRSPSLRPTVPFV